MDIKILIKNLTWFNLVEKLKVILNKLVASAFVDAPSDGNQYARQDGEWEQVIIPSAGVESITGDYVDNSDPLNPILGDPRPYKVYTALLSQTGTSAPVATVLENTLSGVTSWTREGVGQYKLATSMPFDTTKIYFSGFGLRQVITFVDGVGSVTGQGIMYCTPGFAGTDFWFVTLVSNTFTDLSTISPSPIVHLPEIRVYN